MPRLDVRIKVNLAATVVFSSESARNRSEVRVRELSLGGGMFTGLSVPPETQFSIDLVLPTQGRVKFAGALVRSCQSSSAVKFYFPDKKVISTLWQYLRSQPIRQGSCPYCGRALQHVLDNCALCGQRLTFLDDGYLDQNLLTTFQSRVQSRMGGLDANFLRRLISLMDAEILDLPQEAEEDQFVGTAPAILEVFAMIRKAATTNMNILILGESGTGKELTALAIHEKSLRRDKPFVVVNCAAIPEGLLEAELFGYEKGAFTGANLTKKGRFELADGGTLFLDEIGDMPHALQSKLLRFLEDHKIERVGGKSGKKVDIRIIAATNCDLAEMVEDTSFRGDLFFRLNSFTIKLPPLRERGTDKVVLAKYFFNKFSKVESSCLTGFSDAALKAILHHNWPGNVRELVNKVRRGLVMANGEYVEPADMELGPACADSRALAIEQQRKRVLSALEENGFIVAHTAKSLQISRPTLYSLIKRLDIDMTNPEQHRGGVGSCIQI